MHIPSGASTPPVVATGGTSRRRSTLLALVVVLALPAGAGAQTTPAPLRPAAGGQEGDPWPMAGRDPAHTARAAGPAPPYREAWATALEAEGAVAGPVVGGGRVIVVTSDRLMALSASTGAPDWEVRRASGPAGPAAIAGDLVVYSEGTGEQASLVAVRLEDGEPAWRARVGGAVAGGPAVDEGRLFAGTTGGEVLSLEAESGTRRWDFQATGQVDTSPVVSDGIVLVAAEDFASGTATVHALDAETGEERWRHSPRGSVAGASSLAGADGSAFIGLGDFRVHAFDAENGVERWTARARSRFSARLIPSLEPDLLIGDASGHLYRIDRATGATRWVFRLDAELIEGSPVSVGGAAVTGDGSGTAAAIDLESGLRVWRSDLGDGPIGAPAADGERLYLAVQGRGGRVVALEHDPQGQLLAEPSPTTLFPVRALTNFAVAAGGVFLLLLASFLPLARMRQEQGP